MDIVYDEMGVALSFGLLMGSDAPAPATPAPASTAPADGVSKKAAKKAAKAAAKADKKGKGKPVPKPAEEEEIDLGFGDEEEIDLGFGDEEPAAEGGGKAMSAKERAAAKKAELEEAKKKALERLAKKEAKQRSLCSLEIKPWEADQDLMALFHKIKATVVRDGLVWGENCQLKPVAFGIKKICLTAVINQALSMDEIIEEMTEESFADEIQSMELTSMSLL